MREAIFKLFPEHDLVSSQEESQTIFHGRPVRIWSAISMVIYAQLQRALGDAKPIDNHIISLYQANHLSITAAEKYSSRRKVYLGELILKNTLIYDDNPVNYTFLKFE